MVDTNIGRNFQGMSDYINRNKTLNQQVDLQERNMLMKQRQIDNAQQSSKRLPAALQLANEYQNRIDAGDVEGANNLAMFAKTQDKNVYRDAEGILQQRAGIGQALGGIGYQQKYGEQSGIQRAKQEYEPTTAGLKEQAKLGQQLEYAPKIDHAKALSEQQTTAQLDLPDLKNDAQYMDGLLNQIKTHKGLDIGTGRSSYIPSFFNQDKVAFDSLIDQVKGKQFMQAYQTLKGGGVITEIEGEKATNALSRMNTAQSKEDFLSAVNDFQSVVEKGLEREKLKARPKMNRRQAFEARKNEREGAISFEEYFK